MFNLPDDISYYQEQLPNGVAFNFRHSRLGDLGRILFQDRADGQTQIVCEVVGEPDDPMTAQRAAIFEPIGKGLSARIDKALGGRSQTPDKEDPLTPEQPPVSIEKIASKLIPCERCGRPAALLIFADHAQDVGGLEDYARLMFAQINELDVPTWIIAPPQSLKMDAAANILKVHPEREPVCQLTPDEFNIRLDRAIASHCH